MAVWSCSHYENKKGRRLITLYNNIQGVFSNIELMGSDSKNIHFLFEPAWRLYGTRTGTSTRLNTKHIFRFPLGNLIARLS